jgi:cardiolipin synthase
MSRLALVLLAVLEGEETDPMLVPPIDRAVAPSPATTLLLEASELVELSYRRASGAPRVEGNAVRILKDGAANYAAWFAAIGVARKTVFFENYIIEDDEVGGELSKVLIDRARAGVKVRMLHDWLGSLVGATHRYWRELAAAGVEVRRFNTPRIDSPVGWLCRDHRKTLSVDGEVAFVTGVCVSHRWLGDPARGIPPWRDTGIEIRGPGVGYVERAFAEVWEVSGGSIPAEELSEPASLPHAGDVSLRIIADVPSKARLFRLDQLIASAARRTLWLTDAYFVGFAPYVQALCAAAQDAVDVRLPVPSTSDIMLVAAISRAGYRPLLESGVRIFEWNGSMLHAKTAVADGCWARVGSSNLNPASFISNYEIDVAMEHVGLAREMEEMFLADLENATEIVVDVKRRVVPDRNALLRGDHGKPRPRGASGGGIGVIRFAHAVVGTVVGRRRSLGLARSHLMVASAGALLVCGAIALIWPMVVALPLAVVMGYSGATLMVRAIRHWRRCARERRETEKDRATLPLRT